MSDAPRPLARIWLVANHASGSTSPAEVEALVAAFEGEETHIVGRTIFPDQPLPRPADLREARADTLLIIGGDGTINAATDAAADWDGQCLVLPGGTMNLLPKALHGMNGREHILAAAPAGRLVRLPMAEAEGFDGPRRALCGVILGPAASWVHAREGVRKGRFWQALRAARHAWARTFTGGVRVTGRPGRHRAVLVTPDARGLDVAMVDANGIGDALSLGWHWLTGDWRSAQLVSEARSTEVELAGRRRVRALFDGEPTVLPTPVLIRHGWTRLRFIATADVTLESRAA